MSHNSDDDFIDCQFMFFMDYQSWKHDKCLEGAKDFKQYQGLDYLMVACGNKPVIFEGR